MKKYFLNLIAACTLFSSCENMMDVHKPFIIEGEKVYATKHDEINCYAGHNQVYFEFYMANLQISICILYWDQDSMIILCPHGGMVKCLQPKKSLFV